MNEFQQGDIVLICKEKSNELGFPEFKLMTIFSIENGKVKFAFYENIVVDIEEIKPVEITDHILNKIKYYFICAATVNDPNQPKAIRKNHYKTLYELLIEKEYFKVIEQNSIRYIHQLQHFLNGPDHYNGRLFFQIGYSEI